MFCRFEPAATRPVAQLTSLPCAASGGAPVSAGMLAMPVLALVWLLVKLCTWDSDVWASIAAGRDRPSGRLRMDAAGCRVQVWLHADACLFRLQVLTLFVG